jgi:hypothetical protein
MLAWARVSESPLTQSAGRATSDDASGMMGTAGIPRSERQRELFIPRRAVDVSPGANGRDSQPNRIASTDTDDGVARAS